MKPSDSINIYFSTYLFSLQLTDLISNSLSLRVNYIFLCAKSMSFKRRV